MESSEEATSSTERSSSQGRRVSGGLNATRFSGIPFASPLGQVLQRKTRVTITPQLHLDRYERYCVYQNSRLRGSGHTNSEKVTNSEWPVSWKSHGSRRKGEPWTHLYCFTRKQKKERLMTINTGLNKRGRQLLKKCKLVRVVLKKLTVEEIRKYISSKSSASDTEVEIIKEVPSSCRNVESLSSTSSPDKARSVDVKSLVSVPKQKNLQKCYVKLIDHVNKQDQSSCKEAPPVVDLCSSDEDDEISFKEQPSNLSAVCSRNLIGSEWKALGLQDSDIPDFLPFKSGLVLTNGGGSHSQYTDSTFKSRYPTDDDTSHMEPKNLHSHWPHMLNDPHARKLVERNEDIAVNGDLYNFSRISCSSKPGHLITDDVLESTQQYFLHDQCLEESDVKMMRQSSHHIDVHGKSRSYFKDGVRRPLSTYCAKNYAKKPASVIYDAFLKDKSRAVSTNLPVKWKNDFSVKKLIYPYSGYNSPVFVPETPKVYTATSKYLDLIPSASVSESCVTVLHDELDRPSIKVEMLEDDGDEKLALTEGNLFCGCDWKSNINQSVPRSLEFWRDLRRRKGETYSWKTKQLEQWDIHDIKVPTAGSVHNRLRSYKGDPESRTERNTRGGNVESLRSQEISDILEEMKKEFSLLYSKEVDSQMIQKDEMIVEEKLKSYKNMTQFSDVCLIEQNVVVGSEVKRAYNTAYTVNEVGNFRSMYNYNVKCLSNAVKVNTLPTHSSGTLPLTKVSSKSFPEDVEHCFDKLNFKLSEILYSNNLQQTEDAGGEFLRNKENSISQTCHTKLSSGYHCRNFKKLKMSSDYKKSPSSPYIEQSSQTDVKCSMKDLPSTLLIEDEPLKTPNSRVSQPKPCTKGTTANSHSDKLPKEVRLILQDECKELRAKGLEEIQDMSVRILRNSNTVKVPVRKSKEKVTEKQKENSVLGKSGSTSSKSSLHKQVESKRKRVPKDVKEEKPKCEEETTKKPLPKEIKNLLSDECKELRRMGLRHSYRTHRDFVKHTHGKHSLCYSRQPLYNSNLRQGKRSYIKVVGSKEMSDSERAHRCWITGLGTMCVLNYDIPSF